VATAIANMKQNLQNASDLFESYLVSIFDQTRPFPYPAYPRDHGAKSASEETGDIDPPSASTILKTGGRAATTRHIEGRRSLCVGMPKASPREGWQWFALDRLAHMESGHTPSRRHPEYWGGDVPWIGIRDAKAAHGREIHETQEYAYSLKQGINDGFLTPFKVKQIATTLDDYPTGKSPRAAHSKCPAPLAKIFLFYRNGKSAI
jgi:hypothetical protein